VRQVEHHERIEREVHREVVRVGDPPSSPPPQAPADPPATPHPAAAVVTTRHVVEMVERITGHAPAAEHVAAPETAQPTAMAAPTTVIAAPPRQEMPAPATRQAVPSRRSQEPAPPPPVHVHIDRIEVRTTPVQKPRRPSARPPARSAPSLEAFLAGKAGER
jgi:hypothetical protein